MILHIVLCGLVLPQADHSLDVKSATVEFALDCKIAFKNTPKTLVEASTFQCERLEVLAHGKPLHSILYSCDVHTCLWLGC
jgi:hypothetical protein